MESNPKPSLKSASSGEISEGVISSRASDSIMSSATSSSAAESSDIIVLTCTSETILVKTHNYPVYHNVKGGLAKYCTPDSRQI